MGTTDNSLTDEQRADVEAWLRSNDYEDITDWAADSEIYVDKVSGEYFDQAAPYHSQWVPDIEVRAYEAMSAEREHLERGSGLVAVLLDEMVNAWQTSDVDDAPAFYDEWARRITRVIRTLDEGENAPPPEPGDPCPTCGQTLEWDDGERMTFCPNEWDHARLVCAVKSCTSTDTTEATEDTFLCETHQDACSAYMESVGGHAAHDDIVRWIEAQP